MEKPRSNEFPLTVYAEAEAARNAMQTVFSGGDDTIFVGQVGAFVEIVDQKTARLRCPHGPGRVHHKALFIAISWGSIVSAHVTDSVLFGYPRSSTLS